MVFSLILIVIFGHWCVLIFYMQNTDFKRKQITVTRKMFLVIGFRTLDICWGAVFDHREKVGHMTNVAYFDFSMFKMLVFLLRLHRP